MFVEKETVIGGKPMGRIINAKSGFFVYKSLVSYLLQKWHARNTTSGVFLTVIL